jgi:hypothetical protein
MCCFTVLRCFQVAPASIHYSCFASFDPLLSLGFARSSELFLHLISVSSSGFASRPTFVTATTEKEKKHSDSNSLKVQKGSAHLICRFDRIHQLITRASLCINLFVHASPTLDAQFAVPLHLFTSMTSITSQQLRPIKFGQSNSSDQAKIRRPNFCLTLLSV